MAAYKGNRDSANDLALEVSPIVQYIRTVAEVGWEGTAKDLLNCLIGNADEKDLRQRGWPKTPKSLSGALRRLAPNFRAAGIEIQFARDKTSKRQRMITIIRTSQSASSDALPVSCPENSLPGAALADKVFDLDGSDANIPASPPVGLGTGL